MAFDPSSAKPLAGGFDPSSAKPTQQEGAAFGIYPRQRATPSRPETKEAVRRASERAAEFIGFTAPEEPQFSFEDVGSAAGFGAAAGAFGPKALQYTGKGLKMIPTAPTRAAGTLAETLGTSLQAIPATKRVTGTAALTGGTQAAGQLAEQAGAPRIVGELGFAGAAPRLGRLVSETVIGRPTFTSERAARKAEDLGFKVSSQQVKEEGAVPAYGQIFSSKENQELANRLASKGTGKEAREINEKFISGRFKELGKQYDDLYNGKIFRVDPSVQQSLQSLIDYEQSLGIAGVSTVKKAADTILQKLQTGGPQIVGDDLQRLRNAITQRARSSASRTAAHEMYDFVRLIDDAVALNNPAFRQRLTELNPKYRNTVILEDLYRSGGIEQGNISLQQLGEMLRGKKDVLRRSPQDIDELGEIGRVLQMRALWEPAGKASVAETAVGKALGLSSDIGSLLLGTRGATARDIQRGMLGTRPIPPRVGVPVGVGAAELTRSNQPEE